MYRAILALVCGLALFPLCSAAAPTPKPSPSPSNASLGRLAAMAPADAYFGPFGMSPLSIRSTIGLLGRQYHERTISDRDLLRKALITEDALRRWRAQYPADPWMAPTFYHLEQLYQAVQSQEARKHAAAVLNEIVRDYPTTKEGHLSRSRIAAGFPPLLPESAVVAAPPPMNAPLPSGSDLPAPSATAVSGSMPAAGSSPAGATPSPAPTGPGLP